MTERWASRDNKDKMRRERVTHFILDMINILPHQAWKRIPKTIYPIPIPNLEIKFKTTSALEEASETGGIKVKAIRETKLNDKVKSRSSF